MEDPVAVDRDTRGQRRRHPEWGIAQLAEAQFGVVTHEALVDLGLEPDAIDRRVRRGSLHRLYRGVYAVGHRRLGPEGHRLAAVLAHGKRAVLSHRSAAAHWELRPHSGRIEVTALPGARSHGDVLLRRTRLAPDEVTLHRGIPVTTVERTLLDLASVIDMQSLARAIRQADYRGIAVSACSPCSSVGIRGDTACRPSARRWRKSV